MKLTKKSIAIQLCNEFLAWKDLNLRPEDILGRNEPKNNFEPFRNFIRSQPAIKTGHLLSALEQWLSQNQASVFLSYFQQESHPLPKVPSFCAIPLFQEAVVTDALQDEYNDEEQLRLLIQPNCPLVQPSMSSFSNGVKIAAETSNVEMLAFLLRPEFQQFKLTDEFISLVDNPKITTPLIRQIIFRACSTRMGDAITEKMMNILLSKINTIEEWWALFENLSPTKKNLMLDCCSSKTWLRLIHDNSQLDYLEAVIDEQKFTVLLEKLLTQRNKIEDGRIIIRLMQRMNQIDRLVYAQELGARVNTLFTANAPLKQCLTLLGYEVNSSGEVKLKNIFGPSDLKTLLPAMNRLHKEIWKSSLDNAMKLRYFYVVQQLLVASAEQRSKMIKKYNDCVKRCEGLLSTQEDAGRNFFIRWIRSIFRFFGLIAPMPLTIEAKELLTQMNTIVSNKPQFHATILDFNDVVLPAEPASSARRIRAITWLTEENYDDFWRIMTGDEQLALLKSKKRFSQLLKSLPNSNSIERLIKGLGDTGLGRLVQGDKSDLWIDLLQMPELPMSKLMAGLGDKYKTLLLSHTTLFGSIVSSLPTKYLDSLLKQFHSSIFNLLKEDFMHLQAVILASSPDRYGLLNKFFKWKIPLDYSPDQLGQLFHKLPLDKVTPVWMMFLKGSQLSASVMTRLLKLIKSSEKRSVIVNHWMTSTSIPPWSDAVIELLPNMNSEQQTQVLAKIKVDDLKRLVEQKRVQEVIFKLKPDITKKFLDYFRGALSSKEELNQFLEQLNPSSLNLLVTYPPYEFLTLSGCRNVLNLIRALPTPSDEHWKVIAPKILGIGESIFRNDSLVALFQEHVPMEDHIHLLTVLRNISDDELQRLISFLDSAPMIALMKHKKLSFIEMINIDRVREMAKVAVGTSPLEIKAERKFEELIKSHQKSILLQVDKLDQLINQPEKGLLSLLEITYGLWAGYGHKGSDDKCTDQWSLVNEELKKLNTLHAELVEFHSINRYVDGLKVLKQLHEKINGLVRQLMEYVSQNKLKDADKTRLRLSFQDRQYHAFDAVHCLRKNLETMDVEDEEHLLAAVPQECLPSMMHEEKTLQSYLEFTVAEKNRTFFLSRCRRFLTESANKNVWLERLGTLSASSLRALLLEPADDLFPKAYFPDFLSLVSGLHGLSREQWNAISSDLLMLGERHYGNKDRLVHRVTKDVPSNAQSHILNYVRNTQDRALNERLFDFLSLGVVRYLRTVNEIDYLSISSENLPERLTTAEKKFQILVRRGEEGVNNHLKELKKLFNNDSTGLFTVFRPQRTTRCVSSFFKSVPDFSPDEVSHVTKHIREIPGILETMRKSFRELQKLYKLNPITEETTFRQTILKDLDTLKNKLDKLRRQDEDKPFRDWAPECHYGAEEETVNAESYLQFLSNDLDSLIQVISHSIDQERKMDSSQRFASSR